MGFFYCSWLKDSLIYCKYHHFNFSRSSNAFRFKGWSSLYIRIQLRLRQHLPDGWRIQCHIYGPYNHLKLGATPLSVGLLGLLKIENRNFILNIPAQYSPDFMQAVKLLHNNYKLQCTTIYYLFIAILASATKVYYMSSLLYCTYQNHQRNIAVILWFSKTSDYNLNRH